MKGRRVHQQRLASVEIEADPQAAELPGEELLIGVLARMLGPGWEIKDWARLPARVDERGRRFYRLEFVFVPDRRTAEEHRADLDAQEAGGEEPSA